MLSQLKRFFTHEPATDFKRLASEGALIVDVRTEAEFRQGHIRNSMNIPLDKIQSKIADLKKRNKTIITCCQSGNRSGVAEGMLRSAGLEAYNGGAWFKLDSTLK